MTLQGCRGYTLIEMLAVVAICATIAIISINNTNMAEKAKSDAAMEMLARMAQFARTQAITTGQRTALCGSSNLSTCERDWTNTPIIVFVDTNNNRSRDPGEKIIQQARLSTGHIHWNGANPLMRYRPDGTLIEFGTYTYCPNNGSNHYAHQLTINAVGRPYLSHDRNGDGIDESNSSGDPIECLSNT